MNLFWVDYGLRLTLLGFSIKAAIYNLYVYTREQYLLSLKNYEQMKWLLIESMLINQVDK